MPSLPPSSRSTPPVRRRLATAGLYLGAGFHFIGSILSLTVFGWWLDQRLATMPWLGVSGVLIGFVIGCLGLVRILRVAQGPDDQETP